MPKDETAISQKLTLSRKAGILLIAMGALGFCVWNCLQLPLNGYLYFGGKGGAMKVFPHDRVLFELAVFDNLFFLAWSIFFFWLVIKSLFKIKRDHP